MSDTSVPFSRTLLLGGARSGKSEAAERLANSLGDRVVYVATAVPGDDPEMVARVAHHRARRPAVWRLVEEPLAPAGALARLSDPPEVVVLEDLTLLLSNHLLRLGEAAVDEAERVVMAEAQALAALPCHLVLVSNEVGQGIVPATPLGRAFRDALGRVNRRVAEVCNDVALLVAGLPLWLKVDGQAQDLPR